MKRILDIDPLTGVTTYHDYDELTDTTILTTEQDVEPFLERNKALYNDDDRGFMSRAREWKRYASIPNAIIMKWKIEEGIDVFDKDHWPAVKRKLNGSDFRYLRTAPGRE